MTTPIETTTTEPTHRTRLSSLTGLRFIAALLVIAFHVVEGGMFADKGVTVGLIKVFGESGEVGVEFFFILSGFVLMRVAMPGDRVAAFWRRRAVKIFPNHLVTYMVALVLLLAAGTPVGVTPAVLNLFLLHAWIPSLTAQISVNPVAWSLSCEVLFYLAFPLLLVLINRIREERLWIYAAILVAVVWCVPFIAQLLPASKPLGFAPITEVQFWFIYGFPPVRALEFVLGMVMARIVVTKQWPRFGMLPAFVLCVAGYVGAAYVPYGFSLVAISVIPLALLIAAAASADIRGAVSPFRNRVMVFLGEISYAIYLWHYLVIYYVNNLLSTGNPLRRAAPHSTGVAIGYVVVFLVVTLVIATLQYRLVERPMMRRFSRARPPRVDAESTDRPLPVTGT